MVGDRPRLPTAAVLSLSTTRGDPVNSKARTNTGAPRSSSGPLTCPPARDLVQHLFLVALPDARNRMRSSVCLAEHRQNCMICVRVTRVVATYIRRAYSALYG